MRKLPYTAIAYLVVGIVAAGTPSAQAQTQGAAPPVPPVLIAPPADATIRLDTSPPPIADAPLGADATTPLATPPALATPSELVGKSLRDLQEGRLGAAARDDIKALRRGPLLIHGNYCGIGNRPGTSPLDALDAACQRHDACTHTGKLPDCKCDDLLRIEALEIAQDPATRPDIAALATATAASMVILVCR